MPTRPGRISNDWHSLQWRRHFLPNILDSVVAIAALDD